MSDQYINQNIDKHISSSSRAEETRATLSVNTYPCFMTCRFHSFMISFSPSLTSVNSSICCSEKQTNQNNSSISRTGPMAAARRRGNRPWPSSPSASRGPSRPRCPPPSPAAAAARSCRCGSTAGCVRWCRSSAAPGRRPPTPGTRRGWPWSSLVWGRRGGVGVGWWRGRENINGKSSSTSPVNQTIDEALLTWAMWLLCSYVVIV